MAPGCFAKKIKIGGVTALAPANANAKINKTAPSVGDSGSSSIISRKRKPIRESQF